MCPPASIRACEDPYVAGAVTYTGHSGFETDAGTFRVHGDYAVVLVPMPLFRDLPLDDARDALLDAEANNDVEACEWWLTDNDEPDNYDDPGLRDDFWFGLDGDDFAVFVPYGEWVDDPDPTRDRLRAVFAAFEQRTGTTLDLHNHYATDYLVLGLALPAKITGSNAIRLGEEAVALLGASQGGDITLTAAADLVKSGFAETLIGQRESEWLDGKKEPYRLHADGQKHELAKDAAAFANARGGLILIGGHTEDIASGERLSEIEPIPLKLIDLQQHRDVLDDHVFPVIAGLEVGILETSEGRGIAYIYVPDQPQERRPFLVVGKEIDGKISTRYISIPMRRDDDTAYSDVASVHALILAGRLAFAQIGDPPPRVQDDD